MNHIQVYRTAWDAEKWIVACAYCDDIQDYTTWEYAYRAARRHANSHEVHRCETCGHTPPISRWNW